MTLPAQVDEAAQLAEQLHQQMYEEEEDQQVDNTDSGEPDEDTSDDVEENDVPHDDDLEELRKFKARYLTLKGMYDTQVPQLQTELKELKQSVFEKLAQQSAPKPTEPEQNETEDFVSSFAENYGEDFAENLRKLIALEAQKLSKPIEQKVESVEEAQIKTAQTNFINYIDSAINSDREKPVDWQGMWEGKDPKFIEFLSKPDPSGLYTYGQLAELANKNWDADRLVSIFNLYMNESVPSEPEQKQKTPKTNPAKDAIVAPSRSTVHNSPQSTEKRMWTEDMMREFERMDRQGKYSAEESKLLWDDLLSAAGEGRIR